MQNVFQGFNSFPKGLLESIDNTDHFPLKWILCLC